MMDTSRNQKIRSHPFLSGSQWIFNSLRLYYTKYETRLLIPFKQYKDYN